MKPKNKKKKWLKTRHKVVTALLRYPLGAYCKWKYHITVEKFKEQGDRPYLVIMNHQTGFDQFFVGICFNRPVYYIASEDIFSKIAPRITYAYPLCNNSFLSAAYNLSKASETVWYIFVSFIKGYRTCLFVKSGKKSLQQFIGTMR